MSSLKSRPAPTFAEHAQALGAALVEVAESSFFAFAAASDRDQFAELVAHPPAFDPDAPPEHPAWLVTRVAFSGAFAGHVEVAMSEPLARQLLENFVGLGPGEEVSAAQVHDSCGEFCNQVCGTWLTRACQDRRFELAPPAVHRIAPGTLPMAPPAEGPDDGEVLVTLNDLPLRMRIHFAAEKA